jgi:hypothetical protein
MALENSGETRINIKYNGTQPVKEIKKKVWI